MMPDELPNVRLWLRADFANVSAGDGSRLLGEGDGVAGYLSWPDQIVPNYGMSYFSDTLFQPIWRADIANGWPAVEFTYGLGFDPQHHLEYTEDIGDGFFTRRDTSYLFDTRPVDPFDLGPFTIWQVYRWMVDDFDESTNPGAVMTFLTGSGGGNEGAFVGLSPASSMDPVLDPVVQEYAGVTKGYRMVGSIGRNNSPGPHFHEATLPIKFQKWEMSELRFDGATLFHRTFCYPEVSVPASGFSCSSKPAITVDLRNGTFSPAKSFSIQIAEIIMSNDEESPSDRDAIMQYLGDRYNLIVTCAGRRIYSHIAWVH